jgi:hypothetical protein
MTFRGILHGIGYALAGALLIAVALFLWLGMGMSAVWNAVYADRAKARRWHLTPGLEEVLPGSPAWTEREQRVAALLGMIEALPAERFDTFDPSGVIGWTPLYRAAANAPPTVRAAVETARGSASLAVVGRAKRDRPEAGAEDYTLHNAWFLYEPHWEAAERAVAAGAIAILLEGHLDKLAQAEWAAGVARLSTGPAGPGSPKAVRPASSGVIST